MISGYSDSPPVIASKQRERSNLKRLLRSFRFLVMTQCFSCHCEEGNEVSDRGNLSLRLGQSGDCFVVPVGTPRNDVKR